MNNVLKVLGIGCAAILGITVVAVIIIGSFGPDTGVYPGRQVPLRYMKTIRSLNLLGNGEQIRYFYSDAMFDIKSGLYFVTDKNLVLYSTDWEEPKTIIPFYQIESVDAQYDDSFLEDTSVFVTTSTGMEVVFPVSSDKGLDKKFVKSILVKPNAGRKVPSNNEEQAPPVPR